MAFKKSSLGVPLDSSSLQAAHVHRSWPVGTIRRAGQICTTQADALTAKTMIIDRFVKHLADPFIIEIMRQTSIARVPRPISPQLAGHQRLWLPIGFHPAWQRQLNQAVRHQSQDWDLRELLSMAFGRQYDVDLRISWYNMLPSLEAKVHRYGGWMGR